jgi:hypothetical protein
MGAMVRHRKVEELSAFGDAEKTRDVLRTSGREPAIWIVLGAL